MSSLKSNDTGYDINILTGIAFAGLVIKLFFYQNKSDDGVDGPANSVIWGYGLVLISLLGILYITFSLASKTEMQSSTFAFIKTIFSSSFPVLFLMCLLMWFIIMNVSYQSRINKGHVSKDYYTFGFVSTALIILQIIIILIYVRYKMSKAFNETSNQMAYIGYAVGSINYFIAAIMQVILEYFSTDG